MRLTVSIIFIFIAAAVFFLGFMPIFGRINAVRSEIQTLVRITDELQEIAGARDKLVEQYNTISPDGLKKLDRLLPKTLESSRFLSDLENVTSRHGLSIRSVDFQRQDKAKNAEARIPALKFFIPLGLSLSVSGQYPAFRAFLADLEKLSRIIDLSDITFGAQTASPTASLEYSLKGTIYYAP